tara:strand:+ start:3860 stop:5290 length:1431 start_codon:yes stop_codon:yes gene_type:complete
VTARVTPNINILLAKALFDSLKRATNEETFYAATAFTKDSDYNDYSSSFDSESEFAGGADSDFAADDQAFYNQNTLTLHRILPGGISRCVPRIDWINNRIYNAWPSEENFYVLVREFVSGVGRLNVYKCLFSPNTPSLNAPTGTSASPITMSDGYVWQYLYSISNSDAVRFLNTEFMPVPERVTEEEAATLVPGTSRYLQYSVQENAQLGAVYGFAFDSDTLKAGRDSDWTLDRTVQVRVSDSRLDSDLIEQHFQATIRYDSESNSFKPALTQNGLGYVGALKVKDQDGKLLPGCTSKIAGGLGHGSDAPSDLNAVNIMLVSRNIPQDEFLPLAQNQYQMANLIRNPIDIATENIASQDFYVACKSFKVDATTASYNVNDIIKPYPVDDGRRARVVAVDLNRVYYINFVNDKENEKFTDSEQVVLIDGVNKIHTINKTFDRDIIFNSGELIVADWKARPLIRSQDQIESINFVLSF